MNANSQSVFSGSVDDVYAASNLTHNQILMWMGQQRSLDTPIYNMAFTFTIDGELDPERFQAAFQVLVDRSDALRTVIEAVDGVPQQRVLEQFSYDMEFLDLSAHPQSEQDYLKWLEARKAKQIDLSHCLFDSVLVKLSALRFVWYFNQHHIMSDAWSAGLVYKNMAIFYQLALQERLAEAPTLPAYRAYVEHEKSFCASPDFRQVTDYWQNKVDIPYDAIPFYGKTSTSDSARTRRVSYELDRDQSQKLKQLASEKDLQLINQDLTLYSLFTTALLTLLHHLSGREQLRLGTPFHNRPSSLFKKTIGLFIEVGLLDIELEPSETLASLLKKVQQETFTGLRYAQPGISSPDINRAYDVLLNYVNATYPDFAGLPMQSEWIHSGYGDRHHGLRLQVHDLDRTGAFRLHFDFDEELFSEEERTLTVRYYVRILDQLFADIAQPIDRLNLLSTSEWQRLGVDFNRTDMPISVEKTVVQLFEDQVSQTPEAVALRIDDQSLTYAQLNVRANQLAHHLSRNGVGAEQVVALYLDRSLEAIVAILGTLKVGGGYVPLDTTLPSERLALILEETATPVILTTNRLAPELPDSPARTVLLDTGWPTIEIERKDNPTPVAGPNDLAYIIYTSGSTGRPKGAMIRHRNLANYILWAKAYYLEGQTLDFPLFSSLSFDLTVTSIYVPLISGGSVVVYGERAHGNLVILDVIEDNLVDIIKLTPAHLSLIREMDVEPTRLRKIIVGGEDFKRRLAMRVSDLFGENIEIYNEYGPTEATVGCMIHRFDAETDLEDSVPIGRPISNAQVYLLDKHSNPVPPGVIGEMCVGGAGVARGYLKRVELTEEKLVDDPWQFGSTLYRTGDLARWTADGRLQFLGRADHQVKVRGYRVELGEIESNLLAHPDVESVVVTVVEPQASATKKAVRLCVQCGLPDNYPGALLDAEGVCRTCRDYDVVKDSFEPYFETSTELQAILDQAKRSKTGKYDCMVLYSGGKDSSYMLYQLVQEYHMSPLVFSLDNGYISEEAKGNIRRVTDALGVDLVFGQTPHMNAVFVDSLKRHSNVCDGCFKVIYTLSINLALEHGINYIFTGLARGQLFETRLSDMFEARIFDVDEIDNTVMEARKAYHRIDDAVTQLLDVDAFQDDTVFDRVQLIDFYRYTDVPLHEVYRYLDENAQWVRPSDTGRSTNCLINDVGIYIHKKERGFHNYALPYSWDVRVGHKRRNEAIDELDDDIDEAAVHQILNEIGYDEPETGRTQLAAYFVAGRAVTVGSLRQFLSERLPAYMIPTYFTTLDNMPLTTNGKIDRAALPDPAQRDHTLISEFVAPATVNEKALAAIWADVFRLDHIGIHDNFFSLGGDSIISIQIVSKARQAGLHFTPQQLFEQETIAGLASVVEVDAGSQVEQGLVTGEVRLSPIQRWFFGQNLPVPDGWNMSLLVDVDANLEPQLMARALRELLSHHDILRARFVPAADAPDGWQPLIAKTAPHPPFQIVNLHGLEESEQQDRIGYTISQLESGHSLADGQLFGAAYFMRANDQPNQLFISIHHLAVDGLSWNILLEDLETAYHQLNRGESVLLPAKTVSMKRWADGLNELAQMAETKLELSHWASVLNGVRYDVPVDFPGGDNREGSTADITAGLSVAKTEALLREVPAVYNTQINDVLLTALAQSFAEVSGQNSLLINLEGHGREDILNISGPPARTVGWFTSLFPVKLGSPVSGDPGEQLKAVKEQLRAIPNNGIGFGLLRYLCQDEAVRRRLVETPSPNILFNYLGQIGKPRPDALFRSGYAPIGWRAANNPRTHVLEINAWIIDGQLQMNWIYSENLHRYETVAHLVATYMAKLEALIEHCLSTEAGGFTPADFPDAGLNQDDLDAILAEFDESGQN